MKGKLIGLDIGSAHIKVASIKRTGDSFFLESIAETPTTAKGIESDAVSDLESLAGVIRQLLVSSNVKTRDVALCLQENEVYTKIIEMPLLSQAELSAALKFEMEQYVPLPIDKVKTDWQILGTNDDQGKKTMNVMLVAAPLVLLEKYQKLMDLSGLTAESVETEIVSVHRALLPLLSPSTSNMIVHIGAATTTIAIVRSGIIKSVFSQSLGGAALTRAISIELGIDIAQAENYKRAYGFSEKEFEGKIGKILTPVVDSIVGDIKKSILSFREKYTNESVKQVILSGGTALLPGLDVVLANALSTQVVFGNSFAAYNIQNTPPQLAAVAPSYNVAAGLALRNLI